MKSVVRFIKDPLVVIVLVAFVFPFVFPFTDLASEMLIFGLLAVAFNLMLGYTGLLSFGHAALFGSGAYTMGILLTRFKIDLFLGMLAAAGMAATIAFIIGWISIRMHGIYFAMLTLAFNEVLYFTLTQLKDLTGGEDGLRGIYRPDIAFGAASLSIQDPMRFYFFVLVVFVLSLMAMRRVTVSPLGSVFKAIRENEHRAESVGYKCRDYKIVAFAFSGFFAGLAGALFCIHIKYVSLSFCHWSLSGEVIIMALLGGIGSLYGPIIGAALVTLMQDILAGMWERWLLLLGIIFIVFVMFFQGGVWSGIEGLSSWFSRRTEKKEEEIPA